MTDSQDPREWFQSAFRDRFADLDDVQDWKVLAGAAIYRKHTGDLDGAIEAMVRAIGLTRPVSSLARETATNLNYLANLYLTQNAPGQAEETIREAVELSRTRFPGLLADNLWILAGVQSRKGERREALASAEEARHLYHQQGHSHGVAQAEELIARIKTNFE